ncbi:MAG TPA: type VI secretion system tip protein VgrG [Bacteroidia bacterium]|nr:type VI secretion system tip protein VgrG [Bacteroidia bacterium]
MASSGIQSGGVATFSVSIGGSPVPDSYVIHSVHVERRVNRIGTARIVVLDGEPNTGDFPASSSSTFVPGSTISIEAGYDASNTTIFQGIITGQSIRIDELIGSALEVECRDASVKMTVGRKCLTFSNQKDSDIITSIIGNYSGLSSSVTATPTQWPEQVQYYATDWDFILSRAEANGMIITTINNKVTVAAPDADTTSVLTIGYGSGLMEFNADLNAVTQLGAASASTWDFQNQAVASGQATVSYSGPGNLSSKTLSEVVGLSSYQLQTSAPLQTSDLTDWSKALLVKSSYAKIMGVAKFQGTQLVDIAKYITLQGLGDRFNGDYFISGVSHDISNGNWLTDVSLGLSPQWFTEEPDVVAPPASGLLPGARGLFSGTVKQMYNDPDTQYRILVEVPLFDQNGAGIWARLANFYSTNGAGVFFLPEVGDEVIIAFLNEDPRYPVILGSVYSSTKNKPFNGLDPVQENTTKAIVSKSGISVEFNDTDKIFTINTPNKNTMILSDKDQKITIQDQNSNSIVMSSDGITIKSNNNITIDAGQKLTLKGATGIDVQASGGDVQTSGINIKESAQSQFSAQGSMTAQVQGGTELTLKGAMVMIN